MSALAILTKLFAIGLDSWDGWQASGIDSNDLRALNGALALTGDIGAPSAPARDEAALHLALVVSAFGRAFERHWVGTRTLHERRFWRRWFARDADRKAREDDIQARLRMAGLVAHRVGARGDLQEYIDVTDLSGSPLGTPYYRKLWRVFSDPALLLENDNGEREEAPLTLSGPARHEFERHFLLAYEHALRGPTGARVDQYLDDLQGYRRRVLQDSLVADLATWGERHVFGNEKQAPDGEVLLPLGKVYVEPEIALVNTESALRPDAEDSPRQGVLTWLRGWLDDEQGAGITVVQGDFGMGKSLSARTLACELATTYLQDPKNQTLTSPTVDLWRPVFVRCGDDIIGESMPLKDIVRRAGRRHAEDLGVPLPLDDAAFDMPDGAQRVLFILDGLDEVLLGQQALDGLFQRLRDATSARRRVLVLSRPGALPEQRELHRCKAQVGALQGFSADMIERWLEKWHPFSDRPSALTMTDLQKRGLQDLAQTPIVLFMIVETWDEVDASSSTSRAQLYEYFFLQRARGKHKRDCDEHRPVHKAAEALLKRLCKKQRLSETARPEHAMLWLLARLAWEHRRKEWQRRIETRLQDSPSSSATTRDRSVPLTRRLLENLVEDDLKLPRETAKTVVIGALLVIQSDPQAGRDHLHFGHKSFAEFLVARYLSDRLRALANGSDRDWPKREKELLGAHLLKDQDRSFEFLCEFLASSHADPVSPLAWTKALRETVRDWAEDCVNDDRQQFTDSDQTAVHDDQRAILRLAALAIGSELGCLLEKKPTLCVHSPWSMRSVMAWFWATREPVCMIARGVQMRHANLSNITFRKADFRDADLHGAKFQGAILKGGQFERATLTQSNLAGADLSNARLDGADLTDASLHAANLSYANMTSATMQQVDLSLDTATLFSATYDKSTSWPESFDPTEHGAINIDFVPRNLPEGAE